MQITRKLRGALRKKSRGPAVRPAPAMRGRVAVGIVLVVLVTSVAILDFSLTAHGLYGYGVRVAKLGRLSVSIPAACDALALVGVAAAFALAHAPWHVRAYAWCVFGVGASASIAGQLSFAQVERLTWQGYIGAAFWPISLALAAHLAIVVWRWTIIMPSVDVTPRIQEPIKASARVPGVNTWMSAGGRTLLPLRCAVSLPPVPKPRERKREEPPKPPPPPGIPNEDPKPEAGPTLTLVGKVPDKPREVAVALGRQGKTGGDIWRSWGSPANPAKRTVEWWLAEDRKAASGGAR